MTLPFDDGPREACGVVGIYAPGADVARLAFFALYTLQHRGQESAGIATSDGQTAYVHRGMGLVAQVFDENKLAPLVGHLAIGHTRYSTTGAPRMRNAQPNVIESLHGPLAVAHNGNLTDVGALRRDLLARGVGLSTSTDSEVITQMLAAPPPGGEAGGPDWEARISGFMEKVEGAYSLVVLTRDAIFGVRCTLGLRPLCIGLLPDNGHPPGYVLASESCAIAAIGARFLREVAPGELVRIDRDGLRSTMVRPPARPALCVFEYVYFARPDSLLEGQVIHEVRQRLGMELAREAPAEADVVVGVPDSAVPAAIGYARESGIPYTEGLTKNRYIGRTFIHPDDRLRKAGIRLKFNPLVTNLAGRRVVLVDDSIVRGNTVSALVRLLREAGAVEVHVRVSSPPVRHPCFMGVDMDSRGQFVANDTSIEAVRERIGATSLAYLGHEGMMRAVGGGGHCSACFTGRYPLRLPDDWERSKGEKLAFERIRGE